MFVALLKSKMFYIILTLYTALIYSAAAVDNTTVSVKNITGNATVAGKVVTEMSKAPLGAVQTTKIPSETSVAPQQLVAVTTADKGHEAVPHTIDLQRDDEFIAEANSSIILQCPLKGDAIQWSKNGKEIVAENEEEKKLYILVPSNGSLVVRSVGPNCCGEYQCSNGSNKEVVNLWVKPYVHQPEKKFKNVIEGDPFVMDCQAWGHPEVILSWMHNKQPIVLDERIIFKADSLNTTLRIMHTEYNDAGDFECIAQNNYGNASMFMEMHVKDKLAALWPFLGICAEVAILCIIIVIFEKRRSKRLEAEERREETDHLNAGNDAKVSEDLRHRKQ